MTDLPAAVRFATRADEADLLKMCHELHEENGLFDMDEEAVKDTLNHAFDRKGGLIGVIDGPKGIEASCYLLITTIWYTKNNHLEELWNFVRPPFRRSNHATTMVTWAQYCAEKIGLPLMIAILSNHRTEAKVRLYRRKLGVPAGAFFIYGDGLKHKSLFGNEIFKVHSKKRA